MREFDRSLKVLLYARGTSRERIHALIREFKRIDHSFHKIQIYLFASQSASAEETGMVEQIRPDVDLSIYLERRFRQIDLVLIDDMIPGDLHFIIDLMMRQVPIMVERQFTEKCREIFIPGKTVESYSASNLSTVPFTVLRFLRDLRVKNLILREAQRVAVAVRGGNRAGSLLMIQDAVVSAGPSKVDEAVPTQSEPPEPPNPCLDEPAALQPNEPGWEPEDPAEVCGLFPDQFASMHNPEDRLPMDRDELLMQIPVSAECLPLPHHQPDLPDEEGGTNPGKLNKSYFWQRWNRKKESAEPLAPVRRLCFDPVVDLVIINYNTVSYLRQCIQSIRENTLYPYRLIVVDNGSCDGSVDYLRRLPHLHLIENAQNVGYAKACNQGILAGRGEYVVILNTDIKVTRGWLNRMVQYAGSDHRIGVIGPKMINERGQIVGAGVTRIGPVCSSRGWMLPNRNDLFGQVEDCYSVGGACYMIRREALERVGGFDENYFFYYEETDLSLRMAEKGYRVVYFPEVTVLHYHEGSLDKKNYLERVKRNNYFSVSQERFIKKWGSVFQGAPARTPAKEIVIFGLIPWAFRFQRPQQICSRLARHGYRILYINNMCQRGGRLEETTPLIHTYYPDGEGIVYRLLATQEGRRRVVHSIDQILEKLHFDNPILWVDAPYWEKAVQCFDRQFVVYNCMDAYGDFADIKEFCPEIYRMEEDLCHAAEVIFASSRNLQQRLSRYGKLAHLIPNGVDRGHFNLERSLPFPEDMREIPGPIIGYYGAIADWFDFELMTRAAERLPNYSFVFIGDCTVDAGRLRGLPNVYFLGEKPYQELPSYVNRFDIAVIPFQRNELTLATNPVKLYEYLATGKPVVSVDLPEIKPFANVVYVARNHDEFVHFLAAVAGREAWWVKEKRKKAVINHDWDDRAEEVICLLEYYQDSIARKSLLPGLASNGKEGVQ